jgi:hypothetical protein
MRVIILAAFAALLPTFAFAGIQAMVPCPDLPGGCIVTCVQLDAQAASFSTYSAPLQVEMLDASGEVLATATLSALSAGQTRANFDLRVGSEQIDSIRLYTADGSAARMGWIMLKVLCDPCACGCWNTVYKGCICDWRATVEPVVEIVPMPEPEPEFEFVPEPEPVVVVPGRG